MKSVSKGIRKKDAMALVTGKPVYTDDIAPNNCLIVKVLRSPHAHALIEEINITIASKVPGIECILTYQDMPSSKFTMAGQSYPEPSPYDRLILDKRIRCVGEPVAIVAGTDDKCVDRALKLIKVKYEVLEALLDFREAKDNKIVVHPEDDFKSLCEVGTDAKRNLCSTGDFIFGDVEVELSKCAHVIEQTYHTKANSQAMMETFRTFTEMDVYGRLNITSSTQVPFHVRRILATALEIPKSSVRVIKPRIGGGFGAKQSVVCEVFPAIVTMKTGKPAKMIYTRKESMTSGSPRHEMEIKVRLGADDKGVIKAIDMYTLSNAGAYGEHGPTTVGLTSNKSMPLYNGANAYKFEYDVVYSNTMGAGAFRGYGATQGLFALESAVNELASRLNIDPIKIREMNMVAEGQVMPAYYNETLNSCTLDKCLARAKEMIDWDNKYPCRDMGSGKVRSVGVSMAMQGSGISNLDTAAVEIKLNDDGFYTLMIGATDMGTGCDTILAQMAAECLDCHVDNIVVHGVDTDQSPYDTGSYASSTTYITGGAVIKTCEKLKAQMIEEGARLLECPIGNVEFCGQKVFSLKDDKSITLVDLANASLLGGSKNLTASESHYSKVSPPPFMVGIVEIEIDKLTGKVDIIDYVSVVDCGTVINPNLARIQAEGGIAQGIGMALYEEVSYDEKGRMRNDSFLQYKIPTRLDIGNIRVEFESSYEPTGPFGAKSIGEIVINTASPSLANAVYNATGVNIRTLPITAEKIVMGMLENEK
ncbi:molybdopterin cofactor-binding domain-containing protein [Clostridium sp.]|uniref:xanthine dehydrogenase family protein molybdopterin-binding subunit n=1 Tax=Clostridium sp. TaxID=1506 RepID=UPI001A418943|nr:molybdopterin cofactor-binding domain-containing protein [Clostridium sp.]MBK5241666.1 molybdopterin-dependent oxidoreductase [Clostridium sp.]